MLVSKPSNAHIVHIVMHPNVIEVGKYEVSNATYLVLMQHVI